MKEKRLSAASIMHNSNNRRSSNSNALYLLTVSLTILLLCLMTVTHNGGVVHGWDDFLNPTPVPISEFDGFKLTFLSLNMEVDSSVDSIVSRYSYQVDWDPNKVKVTSFALVLCPSLRSRVIDHDPLSSTMEVVQQNDNLLLAFQLSDFSPPSFNFSIVLLGEGSTTEGNYLVANGSAVATGDTMVPECIAEGGGTQENCAVGEGVCRDQCFDPEKYVCLNGLLCPVNHLRCGDDCYNRQDYVCVNGTKLCPVETPLTCGDACYSGDMYTCKDGKLRPIAESSEQQPEPSETVIVGPPPPEETIVQGEETIVQGEETIVQGEETIVQGEETIVQGEETIVQGEETIVQGEETIVQGEETIVQGEETVVQGEETIVQGEETVVTQPEETV